jgi:DNA-binding SARP family transcriptional activator
MNDCTHSLGACFSVRLLGGCQLLDPGARRPSLTSRKARALLAYLAMPVGLHHDRRDLAALLWPNAARARTSLRRALSDLRSCIGDGLQSCGEQVFLEPGMFKTDVEHFVRATRVQSVELLGDATARYTGDFLARLQVDSERFTRWQLLQRQHLRSRMLVCRACESAVRDRVPASMTRCQEYSHAS